MIIQFSNNLETVFKNGAVSSFSALETESSYNSIDLLSEGPIEGLVNSDGQTLNYIDLGFQDTNSLSYGVYYNDVVVRDRKTDLYNFTSSKITFSVGNQVKNSFSECKSIYEYKTKIYDIPNGAYDLAAKKGLNLPALLPAGSVSGGGVQLKIDKFNSSSMDTSQAQYAAYRSYSRPFSHYIKNKYCTSFSINIGVDNLYTIDNNSGDTTPCDITFMINVNNLTERKDYYLLFSAAFIAKGGVVVLPFDITIEPSDKINSLFPEIVVNVYSLNRRLNVNAQDLNKNRSYYVDSIVEKIDYPFAYPYSVVCNNIISSKHFTSIPVRSYDCKLLKIKIPDNYDGEIREYDGDWSGSFSKTLKWTNNPAWIFYDLCTNSRYGMGRGQLNQSDLNKWQLLTLSKYCDELVVTNVSTKYQADIFYFDNTLLNNQDGYNTIYFSTSLTESQIQQKYPFGSILYLYNLRNTSDELIDINFKKIILSVTVSGGIAKLKLCNDFGPRKVLESDVSGNLFKALLSYVTNPSFNVEDKIKLYIAGYFSGSVIGSLPYQTKDQPISVQYTSKPIFDKSLNIRSGYCVAKHPEYKEFLEPRFSSNLILNSENEGLKALTDLSSIFRGMFYFKNGLLNLTTDIKLDPVYIFTNSNVKDGLFNYSSGDLNNIFTVAKVSYSDKTDNFKDKIVYVEDSQMIRKYGIIEKEVLGLGITSKTEAQRVGKWYLATGKLESEILNFVTGFEASMLQIGNIIRISDALKTASVIYGKITSLDFKNLYVYIDREISNDCLGKIIKIFSLINNKPVELNFSISEIDNTNLRLKLLSHAYMSWSVVSKIISQNNGTTLYSGLSASGYDKKAYTNNSFIDNCQISYTCPDIFNQINVVGLSEINNPTIDQNDINYGLQIVGSGTSATLSIIQNGTTIPISVSYQSVVSTDKFKITYDGEYIRYYKNNVLISSPVYRAKGSPLHGVVAMNILDRKIENLSFSRFPEISYGSFANLRSDANFAVYTTDLDSENDLYRIININETSSNEYAITALKYSQQKFDIIEKNEYIDINQFRQKQVIFSHDSNINEVFSASEISSASKLEPISYIQCLNTSYDYTFQIEKEVLNKQYYDLAYEQITLNFKILFNILDIKNATNVFGLMCVINRNGKLLNFNVLKDNANIMKIFLGESVPGNVTSKTNIDFYAFDINYKIINV